MGEGGKVGHNEEKEGNGENEHTGRRPALKCNEQALLETFAVSARPLGTSGPVSSPNDARQIVPQASLGHCTQPRPIATPRLQAPLDRLWWQWPREKETLVMTSQNPNKIQPLPRVGNSVLLGAIFLQVTPEPANETPAIGKRCG